LGVDAHLSNRLYSLTDLMQRKLPRELRDMIYKELFYRMHNTDFWNMAFTASGRFALETSRTEYEHYLAVFLLPGKVDSNFGKEFTELLFQELHDLSVADARTIRQCLSRDAFGFGIAPSTCMIPKFTLCGSLDSTPCDLSEWTRDLPSYLADNHAGVLRPNDLSVHCAPLLDKDQRLAPGFTLRIFLATLWLERDREWYKTNGGNPREGGLLIHHLVLMMRAIKRLLYQLKVKCETAKVEVYILPGSSTSRYRFIGVTEAMMEWNHRQWVEGLRREDD
jgi:hypothetical protein